jgi:hypothetical protein
MGHPAEDKGFINVLIIPLAVRVGGIVALANIIPLKSDEMYS